MKFVLLLFAIWVRVETAVQFLLESVRISAALLKDVKKRGEQTIE